MTDTSQVPADKTALPAKDEQPIIIRKLDRLETTSHTTPGN